MNRTIRNIEDWGRFVAWLGNHPAPYPFQIKQGAPRSLNQNALLHKWYGQIADASGDITATEAKGICHREYGLPIRLRDNQFAWVWERTGAKMTYEKQCSLLASGVLNLSSGMTVSELTEYMNAMQQAFSEQGVFLVIPEDRAA